MEGRRVTCLLDTSVWLRGATEPDTIPDKIQRILGTPKEVFALSAISLWEVAKKHQIGKLSLGTELNVWLAGALASQIQVLPLSAEVICDAMSLPDFPTRDPRGRIDSCHRTSSQPHLAHN